MAKKAAKKAAKKVNKTIEVRKLLEKNPNASPKAISAKLNKRGITMTPAYVSTIKTNLRNKGMVSKGKTQRAAAKASDEQVSLTELKKAKQIADELGGVSNARKLLDCLTQLGCL